MIFTVVESVAQIHWFRAQVGPAANPLHPRFITRPTCEGKFYFRLTSHLLLDITSVALHWIIDGVDEMKTMTERYEEEGGVLEPPSDENGRCLCWQCLDRRENPGCCCLCPRHRCERSGEEKRR